MKMGALSDAAVNEVRALRVMQRIDIRLSGHEEHSRGIRKLAEDRLTSYDYNL
jgi:phosphoribosylformylglycinamidine (FGAM) synthase PurS component